MTQWTIFGPSERSEAVIAKYYLESKKCTSDCESTYVECIIDCQAGTDCQSRCARDYSNCNEHCPCYNFCYEGTLINLKHLNSNHEPYHVFLDLMIIYSRTYTGSQFKERSHMDLLNLFFGMNNK